MSEWISVKDRLPEKGQMVVASGPGGDAVCYFDNGWGLAAGIDVVGADGYYAVDIDFIPVR